MTPLTHLTRNSSQVGLNACQANGEAVVNVCMYKHDVRMVHDVLLIGKPPQTLPSHLRMLRCIYRARNSSSCALVVVQLVHR